MKRIAVLVLALALFVPAVSWGFADVISDNPENVAWIGYRYDNGSLFSYGYGRKVFADAPIWTFSGMNVGNYAGWDFFEVGALWKVNENFWIGPLAGGSVDWVTTPPEDDPLAYLSGTAGGIFAWQFLPTKTVAVKNLKLGLWGYGKIKMNPDKEDSWAAGGGVYLGF